MSLQQRNCHRTVSRLIPVCKHQDDDCRSGFYLKSFLRSPSPVSSFQPPGITLCLFEWCELPVRASKLGWCHVCAVADVSHTVCHRVAASTPARVSRRSLVGIPVVRCDLSQFGLQNWKVSELEARKTYWWSCLLQKRIVHNISALLNHFHKSLFLFTELTEKYRVSRL